MAIRNALNNWKAIWEFYSIHYSSSPPHATIARTRLTPENAWKRIGFKRHCPEFWLLASVIMERLTCAESWRRQKDPLTANQSDLPSLGATPPDRVFTKYDQNSMRQVNELISDFHKVEI